MRQGTIRSGLFAVVIAVLVTVVTPVRADSTITVGDWTLLPNTPDQLVDIVISINGTDQVQGMDLFAQIGDGGTYVGGTDTKPVFQGADLVTGTIFAGNNQGPTPDPTNPDHPLIWVDGITTNTGTVLANGTLVTFKIDTTGVFEGEFSLKLKDVAPAAGPFDTKLYNASVQPINLTITNGRILVPEPATMGLLTLAGLVALARRRR